LLAKTTFQLEDDIDHFSYFMLRLLRRAAIDPAMASKLDVEITDCLDYQTLVYRIEQVADNASNIAKHIVLLRERQLKISDQLIDLMINAGKNANKMYDQAVHAFFSNSSKKAEEIIELGKNVDKMSQEIATWAFLHEKKNPVIICATCSIRESIKRIAEYGREIALYTIHRSFRAK
jgi:phosphate uptake regulator